jgi:hypothetical protein
MRPAAPAKLEAIPNERHIVQLYEDESVLHDLMDLW